MRNYYPILLFVAVMLAGLTMVGCDDAEEFSVSTKFVTAKKEKAPETKNVTIYTKAIGGLAFFSAKIVEGGIEYYLSIAESPDGRDYFIYNGDKYYVDISYYVNQG